jgi:hypothetical protein
LAVPLFKAMAILILPALLAVGVVWVPKTMLSQRQSFVPNLDGQGQAYLEKQLFL